MPSNRPEPQIVRRAAAALALSTAVVLIGVGSVVAVGAQTDTTVPAGTVDPAASAPLQVTPSTVPTTVPPLRAPTTLPDDPYAANCSPGEIVVRPDCGREPVDAGDPGGFLQVSLFFLTCAAIIAMVVFIWWRSRVARDERRRAGKDPVDVARRSGTGTRRQATRRSTRNDPVEETSSKRPEASAGR